MGKICSSIVEYNFMKKFYTKTSVIGNNVYHKIMPFKAFKCCSTLAALVNGEFKCPSFKG
jgi:hypothetical protein